MKQLFSFLLILISLPPFMRHCLFYIVLSTKIYKFEDNLSTQRVKRDLGLQGLHGTKSLTAREVLAVTDTPKKGKKALTMNNTRAAAEQRCP